MKACLMLVLTLSLLLPACQKAGESAVSASTPETAAASDSAAGSEAQKPDDPKPEESPPAVAPQPTLVVRVNEHTFYASPADNPSAEAFVSELSRESIEVKLREYGGFEKVGALPWSIPRNDTSVTTGPGDIMLYQGDQITIFYGSNSWSYSPLAKISAAQEELAEALGSGDVTVQLEIEWSE